jgi:hypothetical protein
MPEAAENTTTETTGEVVETAPKAPVAPAAENPAGTQPKGFDDLEAANAEIARLRKENAKDRIDAKTKAADEARTALVTDLAKALGITQAEEVTVESLQEQLTGKTGELTAAQEAAKTAATQVAILRAAAAANADPDLLLDSTRFQATLADVDITDSKAVETAITSWVRDHPKFAATQVVGASTIEHPGGTGEGAITKETFAAMDLRERANYARTNPEQFKAFAETL